MEQGAPLTPPAAEPLPYTTLDRVYYYNKLMDAPLPYGSNSDFHHKFIFNFLFLLFVQNLKGHRLNTTVIKHVHAVTGVQCVLLCLSEDTSCRYINFRKTSNSDKNCELLRDIHSEKPDLLLKDAQFDHYQLLYPNMVSMNRSCIYKKTLFFIFAIVQSGIVERSPSRRGCGGPCLRGWLNLVNRDKVLWEISSLRVIFRRIPRAEGL